MKKMLLVSYRPLAKAAEGEAAGEHLSRVIVCRTHLLGVASHSVSLCAENAKPVRRRVRDPGDIISAAARAACTGSTESHASNLYHDGPRRAATQEKKKTKRKAVAFEEPAAPRHPHPKNKQRRAEEEIGWGAFCDSLELDRRLARAVAQLGWTRPSLVQSATLPVRARAATASCALGRARARRPVMRYRSCRGSCGTRRPLADARRAYNGVRALVLLPTRELVAQARRQLLELAAYCRESVTVVALRGDSARDDALSVQDSRGDIVCHASSSQRGLRSFAGNKTPLEELGSTCVSYVIDEADLVLGFGYDGDVSALIDRLQSHNKPQGILLSATLRCGRPRPEEIRAEEGGYYNLDEAAECSG